MGSDSMQEKFVKYFTSAFSGSKNRRDFLERGRHFLDFRGGTQEENLLRCGNYFRETDLNER